MRTRALLSFILLALALAPTIARADDDPTQVARSAFTRGLELAKDERWGEALEAFEIASKAKPHALSIYNAAVAERALGHYTRARVRFAEALARNTASGGTELASQEESAQGFVLEIDKLLAHVDLAIDPGDALVAIDGRPIAIADGVSYAGVAPPGPGIAVANARVDLVVDPGAHVFSVAKEGFDTVVANQSIKPGSQNKLALSMTAMPGKLRVDASQGASVVRVDDLDVGLAPVTLDRPAGEYRVEVVKSGYVPYATKVRLQPGQRTELFAKMTEETPITKRWWFWGTIGAVVVTGAIVTFVAVKPSYDDGNQGWLAKPR
jgi:hypothetical protein